MAESSSRTSNGSSSAPAAIICRLPPDQLLSILLRLPIDSILCFGMTCKKLRSLTTQSEALWESICRRDWGASSADALCNHNNTNISWKKLYQKVHQLDSVHCRTLLAPDNAQAQAVPAPRASHSLNFLSGFLVLFGGGCEGGTSSFSSPSVTIFLLKLQPKSCLALFLNFLSAYAPALVFLSALMHHAL